MPPKKAGPRPPRKGTEVFYRENENAKAKRYTVASHSDTDWVKLRAADGSECLVDWKDVKAVSGDTGGATGKGKKGKKGTKKKQKRPPIHIIYVPQGGQPN